MNGVDGFQLAVVFNPVLVAGVECLIFHKYVVCHDVPAVHIGDRA